jgi:hypothetical protein
MHLRRTMIGLGLLAMLSLASAASNVTCVPIVNASFCSQITYNVASNLNITNAALVAQKVCVARSFSVMCICVCLYLCPCVCVRVCLALM